MELLTKDDLRPLESRAERSTLPSVARPELNERSFSRRLERSGRQRASRALQEASRHTVGRPRRRSSRDNLGIPHIYAANDADLFVGFGYAMAQDRLFQLDWLRRKGAGRLAEIVGNDGLEQDVLARTVGLNRIARAEWDRLPAETQSVLTAFSAGVNAVIEECGDRLPIEFDLLDYRPEPWRPIDCLLIENEFRWYLTGRFPVIAIPELARRHLGDGSLYRAFLTAEADDESILSPGDYDAKGKGVQPVGEAVGEPDGALGSNNWVVSGSRTASGKPNVASDPHIAFEAVSCWYEVHLQGGAFDVAGCAYVGMPAVLIGRNRRMTWGITNNICSQRDLYQEKTSPDHPGCFLNGGRVGARLVRLTSWSTSTASRPHLRSGSCTLTTARSSSEILPSSGERYRTGLAQVAGGASRRVVDRAFGNESGRRRAIVPRGAAAVACARPSLWSLPDVDGNIGYQATGRIPIRKHWERGYRPVGIRSINGRG